MKAYGLRNKFKYNYKDNHPKQGESNWWEVELGTVNSKKSARQGVKMCLKKWLKVFE